ncbi:MAG: T9SS type A sorting domain-containing protein [Ginsengibacter sp.]
MLNAGAGYGGVASYHWLDDNVLPGNNFYRIKTTDIAGKLTYTSIIKIYAGHTKSALHIYPNPAPAGIVHLQMNDMPAGTYHVKLMNSAGKTMLVKTVIHPEGNSNEAFNFSNLPKGTYILEVIHPDHTRSRSTIVY